MRFYVFTEQPYAAAWDLPTDSLRVSLESSHCDPVLAADYYHQHIDEWQLADELGLDIFVNEHHSTATCITASCSVTLAILARVTKNARLLALGMPIAHRADLVRTAEEFAMIDVISRGRLDMGLVKGVPYEIVPSNTNPAHLAARFWEAHDFIIKALSTTDGPFSWEGRFYDYRNVNIWPRPWQQPLPPVWISANSLSSIAPIASRGHVLGTVMSGYGAKTLFEEYRRAWFAEGRSGPFPMDRLCYTAFVAVGRSEREGFARGHEVGSYLRTSGIVREPFNDPPGYAPAPLLARMVAQRGLGGGPPPLLSKAGRPLGSYGSASVQDLIDGGLMFAGTPDQVFDQFVDFYETVGGFGRLNIVTHAGSMGYNDVAENLRLFAQEVAPRINAYVERSPERLVA